MYKKYHKRQNSTGKFNWEALIPTEYTVRPATILEHEEDVTQGQKDVKG